MERINSDVAQIYVEIDGVEYAVAPKTVSVAEQLIALQRKCEGKPMYKLWLAELEVLLGREAVRELFVSGGDENIDRIQRIHTGVCRAFDTHADAIEAESNERKAENMASLARSLGPLNELLRQLQRMPDNNVPVIRRP